MAEVGESEDWLVGMVIRQEEPISEDQGCYATAA